MVAVGGHTGGKHQFVLLWLADQFGFARGQCAGFIENDAGDLGQSFKGGCRFDKNARTQQTPGGNHLNHRNRKRQRTGTGNDQNGDGVHQRILPANPTNQPPADKGRQRQGMNNRRVGLCHPISNGDISGTALFGIFHQTHDFGQQRIAAGCRDFDTKRGGNIGGSSKYGGARTGQNGDAFTGDDAGIDIGLSVDHLAIDADPFTGRSQNNHARCGLLRCDQAPRTIRFNHGDRAGIQR